MLHVGKLQINSNFLLAPMSGVTDYPYREIVKKFKPGLVFSEMIASRALLAQNSKTMNPQREEAKNTLFQDTTKNLN